LTSAFINCNFSYQIKNLIIRISIYAFLFPGLVLTFQLSGQVALHDFDSIGVIKPKKRQPLYQFSDNGLKDISISYNRPQKIEQEKQPVLRNAGSRTLTYLTGLSTSSSTGVSWKTGGIILGKGYYKDWIVDMYCQGSIEKQRERVRDEDGSWSVETENINNFYWDKDGMGTIIELKDTIGWFSIIMDPRHDSIISKYSNYVYSRPVSEIFSRISNNLWNMSPSSYSIDFAIEGVIRDKNFLFISNGMSLDDWIFSDDELLGVFRVDSDDIPNNYFVRKKGRVIPYLKLNPGNPAGFGKDDLFRLSILGRLVKHTLML